MDASQYKDYVLVMLFIKYVSDKYAGQPFAPIIIPEGASFKDMVALKGKPDIGDQINKKIIGPLANANKLSDVPDFNDANKLGSGKEMVDRLTNLIAIFENPALDFSRNRADGDDIRMPHVQRLPTRQSDAEGRERLAVEELVKFFLHVAQYSTLSTDPAPRR
jgi:type I restriction enzyme M protein